MATGDRIDIVPPQRFVPEVGQPTDIRLRPSGVFLGFPMADADGGFNFLTRVPNNGTPLSTGLTFQLLLVDDPNNSDAGKVARFGVTVKKIASGTDDLTATGAGTETAGNATMPSTAGVGVVLSLAVTTANADAPSAGDLLLVRIRRIASNAADTHKGVVLVAQVTVSDT